MAIGWVLLFRKFNRPLGTQDSPTLLTKVSKASYGMYLCHMFVLAKASGMICSWIGRGTEGRLGFWSTPAEIILTTLTTFVITAVVCTLIQRIPTLGKWIVG